MNLAPRNIITFDGSQAYQLILQAAFKVARWQNGDVEDCKSSNAGSIPARASTSFQHKFMQNILIWLISVLSILLVLVRPRHWPEAIWSVLGAAVLVGAGLLSFPAAAEAIGKGLDVYLFLAGMMIISELARREGVFDWVAAEAVTLAKGSRFRLFTYIYAVGVLVTIFLSNDATAVVLTPAVLATTKAAKAKPLPYLMACAFIANAASFVLPISNPANLVVYGAHLPPLLAWLRIFALPSLAAIVLTFAALFYLSRHDLKGTLEKPDAQPKLSSSGKITIACIALLAVSLLTASALGHDLGPPACLSALAAGAAVTFRDRKAALAVVRGVSWSVLPLVAGLFVIIAAMNKAGALDMAVNALRALEGWSATSGVLAAGFGVAALSNLMNNLPSGLITGTAVTAAQVTGPLRDAVLVGIDLGPNFSVTGSLATILWLIAIRREGQHVGFWTFLKWGAIVTPPALLAALLMLLA